MKARAITCPHQPVTRGDNTVLVAQSSTATPGTTKQLLPPDRVLKEIYMPDQIKWRRTSKSIFIFSVLFMVGGGKKLLRVYSNCFLLNHTGMVVPRVFHSCWKLLAFDQIQLDAYRAMVWRQFQATFKLWPVIPIFERNEMTEWPRKPWQLTSIGITWHIHRFSTQCLISVFLPLMCFLLVFFPVIYIKYII